MHIRVKMLVSKADMRFPLVSQGAHKILLDLSEHFVCFVNRQHRCVGSNQVVVRVTAREVLLQVQGSLVKIKAFFGRKTLYRSNNFPIRIPQTVQIFRLLLTHLLQIRPLKLLLINQILHTQSPAALLTRLLAVLLPCSSAFPPWRRLGATPRPDSSFSTTSTSAFGLQGLIYFVADDAEVIHEADGFQELLAAFNQQRFIRDEVACVFFRVLEASCPIKVCTF